jgi:hypothetical protein
VNYDGTRLVPITDTPPTGPADQLYDLWCGDEFVAFRWYGPGTPLPEVAAELERLLDRLDIGATVIEARPEGAGLVGVPSWAWLGGGAPSPLAASVTLPGFGTTVTVTATLAEVTWDFGDGSPPLAAGPGAPWPEPSQVRHAYAEPSPAGHPYSVSATVVYAPGYTVDGVAGAPLAPVSFTLTREYPVRELEAVRQR